MLPPKEGASTESHELARRALEIGLAIEAAPLSPTSKQLAFDAEAMIKLARTRALPRTSAVLIAHHALGMLRIRFAHVWHHVRSLLQALAQQWPAILSRWYLTAYDAPFARASAVAGAPASRQTGATDPKTSGRAASDGSEMEVEQEEDDDGGDAEMGNDAEEEEQEEGEGEEEEEAPDTAASSTHVDEEVPLGATLRSAWEAAQAPPLGGTESAHFASQLLEALSSSPLLQLGLKQAADLSALWNKITESAGSLGADDEDDDGAKTRHTPRNEFRGERTARRQLLLGFLKVYAATDATPNLTGADRLYTDCTRLIGHADHRIQSTALDVITRWPDPSIKHYKKQLNGLIGDKSFRETLTLFAVDTQLDNAMAAQHRPAVLPLLTTLLYSKLTQRHGRGGSKNMMAQRRATIFAFFCGFQPSELRPLVDLLLAPLAAVGAASPRPRAARSSSRRRRARARRRSPG